MRLGADFYARSVHDVARDLVGCVVRHGETAGRIVETESYHMEEPACHAYAGVTERTRTLFGEPGHAYVYFSYGIHSLLNAVAEEEGVGAAVLIRALEPVDGIDVMRERRAVARRRGALLGPRQAHSGARHRPVAERQLARGRADRAARPRARARASRAWWSASGSASRRPPSCRGASATRTRATCRGPGPRLWRGARCGLEWPPGLPARAHSQPPHVRERHGDDRRLPWLWAAGAYAALNTAEEQRGPKTDQEERGQVGRGQEQQAHRQGRPREQARRRCRARSTRQRAPAPTSWPAAGPDAFARADRLVTARATARWVTREHPRERADGARAAERSLHDHAQLPVRSEHARARSLVTTTARELELDRSSGRREPCSGPSSPAQTLAQPTVPPADPNSDSATAGSPFSLYLPSDGTYLAGHAAVFATDNGQECRGAAVRPLRLARRARPRRRRLRLRWAAGWARVPEWAPARARAPGSAARARSWRAPAVLVRGAGLGLGGRGLLGGGHVLGATGIAG